MKKGGNGEKMKMMNGGGEGEGEGGEQDGRKTKLERLGQYKVKTESACCFDGISFGNCDCVCGG